jgi:hypothetical protein
MKQILMALVISACTFASAEAQTSCAPATSKSKTAVKHKTTKTTTTNTITACRMVPYQVCTILPGRRSVSCYTTTDSNETQTGPAVIYGPTGPMPGEPVKYKVRTLVVQGDSKGSYCKRNEANDATICYQPGFLIRDENGYYSYGEAKVGKSVTAK